MQFQVEQSGQNLPRRHVNKILKAVRIWCVISGGGGDILEYYREHR